jgi:drug/metabolite transporter (DMT)-like permease
MAEPVPAPAWLRAAPFLFIALWSGGFAFAKIGLAVMAPLTFLALRYGLVLALLAPLFLILRPPLPRRARHYGHLAVVGLLIQGLYFGLCYVSMALGLSAGGLALIIALQPILIALLVPWLAGERVSARRWTGLALGLAGAALVILASAAVEAQDPAGIAAGCGAVLAITFGTLYEKRFGIGHHPVSANLVQYLVGVAALLPVAALTEDMTVPWSPALALSLGYLVIANSLVSLTLLLAMIRHGEAAGVSALFFLVPPLAALIAWAVLGEALPPLAWAGMAIAAAGVVVAVRPGA